MKAERLKALFGGGMKAAPVSLGSLDSDSESGDERRLAAEALIKAVKAGDAEAADLALADHHRAWEESRETEGDEIDTESDPESDEGY